MGRNYRHENNPGQYLKYLLGAVLIMSPLFRGLYFVKDSYIFGVVISVIFLVYAWREMPDKLSGGFRPQVIDIGLLGLLTAYIISTLTAVKAPAAVDMDLKLAVFLLFYIMVTGLIVNFQDIKKLLSAIFASGVAVALVGLAAYSGAAVKGGVAAGRISSTFQYPNALAAYLAVISILGCYLMVAATGKNLRVAIAVGNLLVFCALFGTASRGTFVILPMAYLVFVLLQPGETRFHTFTVLGMSLATGGFTGYLIAGKSGKPEIWGYIILGAALQAAVYLMVEKFIFNTHKKFGGNKKVITAILILALVALGAASVLVLPEEQIWGRLADISLQDRNVVERGYFYTDALKIIKDHPVLGIGGGGWASIYKAYQSYGYITKEVHNFYLQTWVEAGLPGVVSIAAVIIGVFFSFYKSMKSGEYETKALAVTVWASIMVIGLQSALDFTMAYGAIGILLWTMFGLLRNVSLANGPGVSSEPVNPKINFMRPLAILISLLIVSLSSAFLMGIYYNEKDIAAIQKRDAKLRKECLEKALLFNPLDGGTLANLAMLERLTYKNDQKQEHLDKAIGLIDKAVKRDYGNIEFRVEKINILFARHKFDDVIKEAENISRLDPWSQQSYEILAYCYLSTGKNHLKNGDKDKAAIYLKKVLELPKIMKNNMNRLSSREKSLWTATPHLKINTKIENYIGQAAFQLSRNKLL